MLNNLSIAKKISLVVGGIALMSGIVLAALAYFQIKTSMENEAKAKLHSMGMVIAHEFDVVAEHFRVSTTSLAKSTLAKRAMMEFGTAYNAGGMMTENWTEELRKAYVTENPYEHEERYKFVDAGDDTFYNSVHKKWQAALSEYMLDHGFHEIYLITPYGEIVHSVEKEVEFATNLITGPYADSPIADVFRKTQEIGVHEGVFSDFFPDAQDDEHMTAFLGCAVLGDDGQVVGTVIIQIREDLFVESISQETGMGENVNSFIKRLKGFSSKPEGFMGKPIDESKLMKMVTDLI